MQTHFLVLAYKKYILHAVLLHLPDILHKAI